MPTTLARLALGAAGTIVAIRGTCSTTQRLLALGLLPGTQVAVIGVAPLGDPITIEARGQRFSLRRAQAAALELDAEAQNAPVAASVAPAT